MGMISNNVCNESLTEYGIAIRLHTGSAPPPGFYDSTERQRDCLDRATMLLDFGVISFGSGNCENLDEPGMYACIINFIHSLFFMVSYLLDYVMKVKTIYFV